MLHYNINFNVIKIDHSFLASFAKGGGLANARSEDLKESSLGKIILPPFFLIN